jgi:hypothetical protein
LLLAIGTSLGTYLSVMFVVFEIFISLFYFTSNSAGAASAGAASVVAFEAVALVAFPPAGRGMQSASSAGAVELVELPPAVAVPSAAPASAGAAPSPAGAAPSPAGAAPSVAFPPAAAGALQNFFAFKVSFGAT